MYSIYSRCMWLQSNIPLSLCIICSWNNCSCRCPVTLHIHMHFDACLMRQCSMQCGIASCPPGIACVFLPGLEFPSAWFFFFLSFVCLVHEHSEWRLPTNLSQRLCSVNDALESIDDVEPSTKWLAYGYVNGAPRRSSYNFAVEAREKPIQQH